jgi:hypothetical protein
LGSLFGCADRRRAALLAAIVPLSFVCMALSNRERLAQKGGFEGPAQLPGGIETARGGIRPSRQPLPSDGHEFLGDINGLKLAPSPVKPPFLLASLARILYPIIRLACERLRPRFGLGA